VVYYRDQAGYHFIAYISNQYGDPIAGVHINVTLTGNMTWVGQATTDSSGLAATLLNVPQGNYGVSVTEISSNSYIGIGSGYVESSAPGRVQSLGSYSTISRVVDRSNSSRNDVQVFWAGDYGAIPSGFSLYYKYLNQSSFGFSGKPYPFNESQMVFLVSLSDYRGIFNPTLPSGSQGIVWFELFNQTKQAVSWNEFSLSELRPRIQPSNASLIASFFFSTFLSFFVPLMAIIGSYSSYGKDRITGVLESILARPITKLGLGLSRFLTTFMSFSLAGIACVGVVDLLLFRFGGAYLPGNYALAMMGGLVVEFAAFTGLIFLLSHLVKSTGLLLGLSIIMFLILDFFWSILVFLVTFLLGGTSGSALALQVTLASYYANPAQFLSLINTYYFQSASGILIQSSNYGVTAPAIILDGILWASIPFLLFIYLAVKRD